MTLHNSKIQKYFSLRRIVLPIVLGLGAFGYMLYQNYEPNQWQKLTNASPFWVAMALFVMFIRDFGCIYRIRHITEKALNWRQSFNIVMLWEFAASALPVMAGGSAVATYLLHKENIPLGKSLAKVMVTTMLDNIYFILAVPLVLVFTKGNVLPEMEGLNATLRQSVGIAFFISYLMITLYATLVFYALFINPKKVKRLLLQLAQLKPLERWHDFLSKHANELLTASQHLQHKSLVYWLRASISTAFVWTARYVIIGCLIAAFTHLNLHDQLVIFSRNLMYKVALFLSVTPGASGFAEIVFPAFFGAFLGGFTTVIMLLYRLLTFYLYLIIGAVVFPRWSSRPFNKKKPDYEVAQIISETSVRHHSIAL